MNRTKPRLDITIDADVLQWIKSEAAAHHLKPSQYVNQVLWAAMADQGNNSGAGHQVVNGHVVNGHNNHIVQRVKK